MGWGRKHSVVDYVFRRPYSDLFRFHVLVMDEMARRGYTVDLVWRDPSYRGKRLGYDVSDFTAVCRKNSPGNVYPEHNPEYLGECLENLKAKGIFIEPLMRKSF